MKNFFKQIVFALPIFFCATLSGQILYKPGFIVKQNNDTVYGRIYDGGLIMNSKVCRFKSDGINKVKKYRAGEIKAFKIGTNKLFISGINQKGEAQFLEAMLQGRIELLHQWNGKKVQYQIRRPGQRPVQLYNDYVKLAPRSEFSNTQITTTSNYYQNLDTYKDSLYFFFDSCRAIIPELLELPYDTKSFMRITTNYLNETCLQPDCITYEKDLRKQRDRFGFFAGFTESDFTITIPAEYDENNVLIADAFDVSVASSSVPIGMFYSIPLGAITDRLFFQPEFSYARNDHYSIISTITGPKEISVLKQTLMLPLLLKYQLPIGKFKPAIAAGWEIRYILDYEVPIADLSIKRRFEPGRWTAHAEIAYPLTKKTDVFVRIKMRTNQKEKETSDMPLRESTVSPFYDKTKIKASFHLGITF